MLSFSFHNVLMQLPLAEAGTLLLVTGGAFLLITLSISTVRFHKMIQLDEGSLTSVDHRNDFFSIQVTRYLSKIGRSSNNFVIIVIQFCTDDLDRCAVQEQMLHGLKRIIRNNSDRACLFHDGCVAAIIDTEKEEAQTGLERIVSELKLWVDQRSNISVFRVGASVFPFHGHRSQSLIDQACNALEQADFESTLPLYMAPIPEENEANELQDSLGAMNQADKNAALDPLTGALKPESVGSYMRKYLLALRQKKESATVLCIGINRMDDIIRLHGEEAADTLIASVSELLQKQTRDSDLMGRYHRDDFLIMTPCALEQGKKIAFRLRETVQKTVFLFEKKRIKASVSIGITAYPEHGKNLKDLFNGAYCALERVHEWNTSSCQVYDPAQHPQKG